LLTELAEAKAALEADTAETERDEESETADLLPTEARLEAADEADAAAEDALELA
jgi:hypothetical protein